MLEFTLSNPFKTIRFVLILGWQINFDQLIRFEVFVLELLDGHLLRFSGFLLGKIIVYLWVGIEMHQVCRLK